MADIAMGDPSVMDPSQPAADSQTANAASSSDVEALKAKLQLVQNDRSKQGETNKKLNEQLADMRRQYEDLRKEMHSGNTQRLQESGDYERLWEEAKNTISQRDMRIQKLEDELTGERQGRSKERLKSQALSSISQSGAVAPDQLYQLMEKKLRHLDNGEVVSTDGGVETPLTERLMQLRSQGSGYEHFFSATPGVGMGSTPASSMGGPTSDVVNPWKPETLNITGQMRLLDSDPQLARILQAEARS